MSSAAAASSRESGRDGGATLFDYEIRRDARVVARLRAIQSDGGFVVESQVFPLSQGLEKEAVSRPFAFSSLEHAHRFVDEAIVAFEYLNCTIS